MLDAAFAVGLLARVAGDDRESDIREGGAEFFREILSGLLVVGVVDGDIGAFGGELAGDFCAEAAEGLLAGLYSEVVIGMSLFVRIRVVRAKWGTLKDQVMLLDIGLSELTANLQ